MRGKRENTYIYIYIGPRSRDNEATSPIQRVTRGEVGQRNDVVHPANDTWRTVGKSNRRNSICEATRANQKSTRGISWEDEMNPVGQSMILLHVARKDPCERAVNYVFILDDPLNKGATDRMLNLGSLQFVHKDRP